jgi:hypothetical protein
MKLALATFAVITLVVGFNAKADILADYPFTSSSRASTDVNPDSAASNIGDGAGITSSVDATRGNVPPSLAVFSDDITGTSNTTSVTANEYVTFTLTPNSGQSFSLTNLNLDAANFTNDATFSAESFFLRSSANAFASNIGSTQNILAGSNGTFANFNFDLSGASFQNQTSAIEFRIYFQDTVNDPDRGILLDNIVINGTTATSAVPEPATWMLMGVGLLLGAQRLRRKA